MAFFMNFLSYWFLIFFLPILFFVVYILASPKRKGSFFYSFFFSLILLFLVNRHQAKGKVAVDNSEISVPLFIKEKVNHDTYNFTFKLPEEDMILGIGVGQCIILSYRWKKYLKIKGNLKGKYENC